MNRLSAIKTYDWQNDERLPAHPIRKRPGNQREENGRTVVEPVAYHLELVHLDLDL